MAEEISTFSGAGAKLLYDVCGPTAKYLGDETLLLAKAGAENLKSIFENARLYLEASGKQGGAVPPKVLKEVVDQGYFCDDSVEAEYLGGILASSKSGVSRDDRAISYLSIIKSLSSYQVRTHFILYSAILRMDSAQFGNAMRWLYREDLTVSILTDDYFKAMDFAESESPELIMQHSFIGLQAKGLIKNGEVVVPHQAKTAPGSFVYFYPSSLGVELFLWGCGRGGGELFDFRPDLLEELHLPIDVKPFKVDLGHVMYG